MYQTTSARGLDPSVMHLTAAALPATRGRELAIFGAFEDDDGGGDGALSRMWTEVGAKFMSTCTVFVTGLKGKRIALPDRMCKQVHFQNTSKIIFYFFRIKGKYTNRIYLREYLRNVRLTVVVPGRLPRFNCSKTISSCTTQRKEFELQFV